MMKGRQGAAFNRWQEHVLEVARQKSILRKVALQWCLSACMLRAHVAGRWRDLLHPTPTRSSAACRTTSWREAGSRCEVGFKKQM